VVRAILWLSACYKPPRSVAFVGALPISGAGKVLKRELRYSTGTPAAGTVTVRTNRVELLETHRAFDAPPKTDAGKRTVAVPPHALPILAVHMG